MCHFTLNQVFIGGNTCVKGELLKKNELSKETLNFKEIVELLTFVGLMKAVTKIFLCYENLVRGFIVNVSPACNDEESQESGKFYV